MAAFAKYEAIPVTETCVYTSSFSTVTWRIKSLLDYIDLYGMILGKEYRL